MSAIPLTEFKQHLNVTRTADDAEIQRTLDAAESWVNAHTGGQLGGGSRTVTARSVGGRMLLLPVARLAGLVALQDPDGNTAAPAPGAVDAEAGIIELPYCRRGAWTATVTFPEEIPADLRLATLIIGKHLWETQRAPGQAEGARPGFGAGGSNEVLSTPLGFAIPHRAKELLARYWLPGIA